VEKKKSNEICNGEKIIMYKKKENATPNTSTRVAFKKGRTHVQNTPSPCEKKLVQGIVIVF